MGKHHLLISINLVRVDHPEAVVNKPSLQVYRELRAGGPGVQRARHVRALLLGPGDGRVDRRQARDAGDDLHRQHLRVRALSGRDWISSDLSV